MAKKKITQDLIDDVFELAELGLQNYAISEATGLGLSTLATNPKIKNAIHEGRKAARRKAMERLQGIAEADASTAFRIAERLGCFRHGTYTKRPEDAKQALRLLSDTIKRYAEGEIPETVAKTLEALSNSLLKGIEVSELEERLERIEKALEELSHAKKD